MAIMIPANLFFRSPTPEQQAAGKLTTLACSNLSPLQEGQPEASLVHFVLNMLYRLVLADEHYTARTSCMRIFLRMDISVFERNGQFHYFINELTRSHQTGLFLHWDKIGKMDFCIQDLANILHFYTYDRLINSLVC